MKGPQLKGCAVGQKWQANFKWASSIGFAFFEGRALHVEKHGLLTKLSDLFQGILGSAFWPMVQNTMIMIVFPNPFEWQSEPFSRPFGSTQVDDFANGG